MSVAIIKKEIQMKDLKIAYLEAGPENGRPVVLFHGFPDSAYSYSYIMEQLAKQGYKVYAPFLRGFYPTQMLEETVNPGNQAILGQDAIDFFDVLKLDQAILVGQDWGSPLAEILAFSRPEHVAKLVKLNWYGIYTMAESRKAERFEYEQMRESWYIWMLNTPLGEAVTVFDPVGFSKSLWKQWTFHWNEKQEQLFEKAKEAFLTPDFGKTVLSAYRSGMAYGKTAVNKLEEELRTLPSVPVDTIVLSGTEDPVESTPLPQKMIKHYFTGKFTFYAVEDTGHFIHHEKPEAVIRAITD